MRLILLILALNAVLLSAAHSEPSSGLRPYSCRLYDDAQKRCGFGQCDAREIDRLRKECLRDNGRP